VTADSLERAARRLEATLHAEGTEASAQAAVARELRMVLAAIDARPKQTGDTIDELAARRKTRRRTG
jgi:hypothetical protein